MVKESFGLSKSKKRRIISTLMSTYSNSTSECGRFHLKNNNETFTDRMNSVFDGLNALETQHEEWQKNQSSSTSGCMKPDPDIHDEVDVSTASRFKRPGKAAKRSKLSACRIPGYRRHPDRWVKYSLAEVSPHDMSEKSNKRAAMTFLKEVREKRFSAVPKLHVDSVEESKPVFRKPSQDSKNVSLGEQDLTDHPATSVFQTRKIIMPEYNFGSEQKKPTRPGEKKAVTETKNCVSLCHLDYEEEVPDADT